MIRPRIVPYTVEWQGGLASLLLDTGKEWSGLAALDWNPMLTFVAVWKGRVVGFIAGYAGQPVGIIDQLIIAPDVSGQGVGVALWRTMIGYLRDVVGVKRIRVLTGNRELERILHREGFATLDEGVLMEGDC